MKILFAFFLYLLCLSIQPNYATEKDSNHSIIVEQIELEGNKKTKRQVILRHMSIRVGAPLAPDMLLVDQQRLEQSDFFKEVDVYTRPGSEKGQLIVVVQIVERSTWPDYRFEGGNSDLSGWYIVPISFDYDNFSGRGHRLDWRSKIGSRDDPESLHYQYPYALGGAAAIDIYHTSRSQNLFHFIGRRKINQTVRSGSFRVQISDQTGRFNHAFISLRREHYRPKYEEELATLLAESLVDKSIVSLALGVQTDARDNSLYPRSGIWGRLAGELAASPIGSDENFVKLEFDVRSYRPMKGRNVFAQRLKGGYTSKGAPFYERFYLGGPFSLRGYDTGRLTPLGWGSKVFLLQNEIRFQLSAHRAPIHKHTGVVYYDAGGIWSPGQIPSFLDLSHALGLGYRMRMRVLGVLRIDFSLPTHSVDENSFRFQISLGNTF